MNSLPLISHHLFVAAIKEDNESPPKYAPGKTVLDLPETTRPDAAEHHRVQPSQTDPVTGAIPARAGAVGF
jgi:hypothetical protein